MDEKHYLLCVECSYVITNAEPYHRDHTPTSEERLERISAFEVESGGLSENGMIRGPYEAGPEAIFRCECCGDRFMDHDPVYRFTHLTPAQPSL